MLFVKNESNNDSCDVFRVRNSEFDAGGLCERPQLVHRLLASVLRDRDLDRPAKRGKRSEVGSGSANGQGILLHV